MIKNLIRKNKYLYTAFKYNSTLREARKNHGEYDYENDILFLAGLPKSGTTWLENMLAEYPGYKKNMLPQAVKFEQQHKGSHFLELREEWLEPLKESLTVLKLHCYGSPNNARVLKELGIPYVVLYRDIRDVAVSYFFYVRQTWHHPEFEIYKNLSVEEGLHRFSETLLPDYKNWITSWREHSDNRQCLIVQYEDLKQNTFHNFKEIVEHYELPNDEGKIKEIIKKNSFKSASGGREEGEENASSFYRKGTTGDWENYFNEEIKDKFKPVIGDQLIELGYEQDLDW